MQREGRSAEVDWMELNHITAFKTDLLQLGLQVTSTWGLQFGPGLAG